MSRAEVVTAIREELAVTAPDVGADAAEDAGFGHDLEVDSLAVLELVARLEYRFGVAVSDEDWPQLTSIAAVADYLLATRTGS